VQRALAGAAVGAVFAAIVVALMDALKEYKEQPDAGLPFFDSLLQLVRPAALSGWLTLAGLVAFAAIVGLMTAAIVAARHGAAERLDLTEPAP
jgi:PAT family beta-lactamase induction signal transducer AmpG